MRAVFALSVLLAGCGDRIAVSNQGPSENQLARLSTPKVETVDPQAPVRVQPLDLADLDQASLTEPSCDFSRDGHMLLAISPTDAVAKVAGTVRHFSHASPTGPTGGFFEDRQVSISVGRTGAIEPGEGAAGTWPARMTVTNRRVDSRLELVGIWRCGT